MAGPTSRSARDVVLNGDAAASVSVAPVGSDDGGKNTSASYGVGRFGSNSSAGTNRKFGVEYECARISMSTMGPSSGVVRHEVGEDERESGGVVKVVEMDALCMCSADEEK